jgi:hypothetical protein
MSDEQKPLCDMTLAELSDLSNASNLLDKEWEALTSEELQEMNLTESDRLKHRHDIAIAIMAIAAETTCRLFSNN